MLRRPGPHQRCQEHKRRNVIEHLPQELHASVGHAMRDAWKGANAELARKQLQRLAASLNAKHPGAAASLREGLEETLTVQALGITGALYRTLRTTNPIENLNGSIAHFTRNVKRWKDGQMTLRWIAGALSDAKGRFRKVARAPRHEDSAGCIEGQVRDGDRCRTQGRVASRMRSRHPAAFNNDRDIAKQTLWTDRRSSFGGCATRVVPRRCRAKNLQAGSPT